MTFNEALGLSSIVFWGTVGVIWYIYCLEKIFFSVLSVRYFLSETLAGTLFVAFHILAAWLGIAYLAYWWNN